MDHNPFESAAAGERRIANGDDAPRNDEVPQPAVAEAPGPHRLQLAPERERHSPQVPAFLESSVCDDPDAHRHFHASDVACLEPAALDSLHPVRDDDVPQLLELGNADSPAWNLLSRPRRSRDLDAGEADGASLLCRDAPEVTAVRER